MKSHLTRPLLAAVVGGSLLAGVVAVAGPFSAAPALAADEVIVDPNATPSAPIVDSSATPTAEPTTTPTTEPTTTPTAEPTTTEPTTTPTAEPTTTPTAEPTTTPPTPDTTAPQGSFKLNTKALWVGQQIALTQLNVKDNGLTDPAAVTRVVTWGDGKSSKLKPKEVGRYRYTRAGNFTITLTLTDAAGNRKVVRTPGVKITVPGKAKLSKTAVWHAERFNITLSSVPAGTTKITLRYGDGSGAYLKGKNQTVTKFYRFKAPGGSLMPAGRVNLTAVYTNKWGDTSQIPIGSVTIKKDNWNPTVRIIKPKNANRISSWKVLRGTAADKGSGVYYVNVRLVRENGDNAYCYTAQRAWIKISSENALIRCMMGVNVRVVKGKWSLTLKGMKKGKFSFFANAVDWSGRATPLANVAEVVTRINRN